MQFDLGKEIKGDRTSRSIISSIVLNGMKGAVLDQVIEVYKENDGVVDITLTIEGHELDVKSYCEFWQSQVRRMIKEEAKKITDELFSFNDIDDLIYDLKHRLKDEIDKRLEDWEKEE